MHTSAATGLPQPFPAVPTRHRTPNGFIHHRLPLVLLACAVGLGACRSETTEPVSADATEAAPQSSESVPYTPSSLIVANTNEPAGYIRLADNPFTTKPTWPRSNNAIQGSWYDSPAYNPNLTINSDATAPLSPGSVVRTRFYKGQKAGVGPVNMGGWVGPNPVSYRKLYFSMWIKIEGTSFENQSVGTKAGFFGVGNPNSGQNQLFFFLNNGYSAQRMQKDFQVVVMQQGTPQPNGWTVRNLVQNVNKNHIMTVGGWHHWEAAMAVNTLGAQNGILKMWIDGTLTHDYKNVVFVVPAAALGFNSWKWNPTWGGMGGVRTRDDYISIDEVYISGQL